MHSGENLGKFYFQHQTESLPSGEFVQSFCNKEKELEEKMEAFLSSESDLRNQLAEERKL